MASSEIIIKEISNKGYAVKVPEESIQAVPVLGKITVPSHLNGCDNYCEFHVTQILVYVQCNC